MYSKANINMSEMYTIAVLLFVLLLLASYTGSVLSQRDEGLVYFGTGTNGSHDREDFYNYTVVLGGLYSVYENDNNTCGRLRRRAIQYIEAMVLAVDKINNDEDLLPGVTLAYEIRKTCIHTNYALEQTLRFITERKPSKAGRILGVSGVVGAGFSSTSIPVASLLRLFKMPQISYAATAEILSDKSKFDYFFRTVPPDSLQARAIADIVIYFNWTYITVLHSDDDYGNGGVKSMQNEWKLRNSSVCLASVIPISASATTKDYDEILERINTEWVENSSIIILFAHASNAEAIFDATLRRQVFDKGFMKNITWIGSESWGNDMTAINKYNELIHGLLSTVPKVHRSANFDEYFLTLNPRNNTANPWFNEYWEEIFNCSLGGQTGVQDCDVDKQIPSRAGGYHQSIFVSPTIDAVYAFAHAIHNMQQDHCPSGRGLCPDILVTHLEGTAINGELLLRYLHNVSFVGTSADRIQFDENGDQEGGYNIFNLQINSEGDFSYVMVGTWDRYPIQHQTSLLINGNIQWKHSLNSSDVPESVCSQACGAGEYRLPVVNQVECCWICTKCEGLHQISDGIKCRECELGFKPSDDRTKCEYTQPEFLKWSHPLAIVIMILSILGIVATTCITVVFVIYHKDSIIKASSRELSAILICGVMLCYLLPFFYIAKPSPALCGIRHFGLGVCFSLCFSALLVKTNRIHRIFNRKSISTQPPPLIGPQSQLFITACLVAVQVLIAVAWLVVEQPGVVLKYGDFTTELICSANPYIGLPVTLAYNLLLLLITTYFAFRTRKVPQNFNEAKFINLAVYTLCILWVGFISMYYVTTKLHAIFQTGTVAISIILSATVTLCCLLVPKVYFMFSNKKNDQSEQGTGTKNLDRFRTNSEKSSTITTVTRD